MTNAMLAAVARKRSGGGGITYFGTILADSPAGYWRLGEASGITAADASGNAHDGTYAPNSGGAWTGGTLGQTGALDADSDTSALFNGSTGIVDCGTSAALGLVTALSVECWIKTTNADGTANPIITKWLTSGSNYSFYLGRVGNLVSLYVGDLTHVDMSESLVNDGDWHHLVATVESSPSKVLRLYVDGIQQGTATWDSTGGTGAKLEIGGNEDVSGEWFDGTIDEPAVYDYTLTPAQIAAHHIAGRFGGSTFHLFFPTWTDGTTGALRGAHAGSDLNGWEVPVSFTPASVIGTGDYSIIKRGSTYFMCYSNTRTFLSNTPNFGVASSPDLVTWTEIATVDLSGASAPNYHCGGPDWFVDDDDSVHVIVQGVDDTGASFQFLMVEPDDDSMETWGTPSQVTWTSQPTKILDPFIVRIGSTYYLWYKNETTKYIEFATASSLLGPYTVDQSGDWAGWGSDVEGASLTELDDGRWLMICDRYTAGGLSWSVSDGPSFSGSSWTPLAYITLAGLTTPRHCTPFLIE